MTEERLAELDIPPMVTQNTTRFETAFHVMIDAKQATSTGISAADRAATVLAAIDPRTRPSDLARPGHMLPLGRATAACSSAPVRPRRPSTSARIAGLYPAGVICEIANKDGSMARVPDLSKFAKRHKLLMITIADLINYRMRTEALVKRVASAGLPTVHGEFRVIAYESPMDRETHVALVRGRHRRRREHPGARALEVPDGRRVPLRALRLRPAARRRHGSHRRRKAAGVLLYLNQEGRGIGLANKIRAVRVAGPGVRHG